MKTTLNELRTIIKDIIKEELEEEDFDILLPVLRVDNIYDVSKNFTGIAKDRNGTKFWYKNGELHREDGPAVELSNGTKYWYKDGKCHREDGPAIEKADGTKEWYINDKLHREDGPAVEYPSGKKEWWINGERHRVEYSDETKKWYQRIFQKEQYDKIISKKYKRI